MTFAAGRRMLQPATGTPACSVVLPRRTRHDAINRSLFQRLDVAGGAVAALALVGPAANRIGLVARPLSAWCWHVALDVDAPAALPAGPGERRTGHHGIHIARLELSDLARGLAVAIWLVASSHFPIPRATTPF